MGKAAVCKLPSTYRNNLYDKIKTVTAAKITPIPTDSGIPYIRLHATCIFLNVKVSINVRLVSLSIPSVGQIITHTGRKIT